MVGKHGSERSCQVETDTIFVSEREFGSASNLGSLLCMFFPVVHVLSAVIYTINCVPYLIEYYVLL